MTEDLVGDTWHLLNQVRREAMIRMCFNMGPGNLAKFRLMLACLAEERYSAQIIFVSRPKGRARGPG